MDRIVTATFDGQVFQPDTPLDLQPNTRYILTVHPALEASPELEGDAWDLLKRLAGTIDAPPDWSIEHDHYIHGTPNVRLITNYEQ